MGSSGGPGRGGGGGDVRVEYFDLDLFMGKWSGRWLKSLSVRKNPDFRALSRANGYFGLAPDTHLPADDMPWLGCSGG